MTTLRIWFFFWSGRVLLTIWYSRHLSGSGSGLCSSTVIPQTTVVADLTSGAQQCFVFVLTADNSGPVPKGTKQFHANAVGCRGLQWSYMTACSFFFISDLRVPCKCSDGVTGP